MYFQPAALDPRVISRLFHLMLQKATVYLSENSIFIAFAPHFSCKNCRLNQIEILHENLSVKGRKFENFF